MLANGLGAKAVDVDGRIGDGVGPRRNHPDFHSCGVRRRRGGNGPRDCISSSTRAGGSPDGSVLQLGNAPVIGPKGGCSHIGMNEPSHGEICRGCVLPVTRHAVFNGVCKILILRVHLGCANDVGGGASIPPGHPRIQKAYNATTIPRHKASSKKAIKLLRLSLAA